MGRETTVPRTPCPRRGLAAAAASLLLLSACAAVPRHQDAGDRLGHFRPAPTDPRVLVEPGAEALGDRVSTLLPDTIAQVEAGHYQPFREPVRVYVCGTEACFDRLVPARLNLTAAVLYENRVVLAPRLFHREPERLQPILAHELSHLHFGQRAGHYSSGIPVWFHEGLASLTARGGGADLVGDDEARRAASLGRRFRPEQDTDGVLRRNAEDWGLSISVFYRQAMQFVAYLKGMSEERFRSFLLALQERQEFGGAFARAFGIELGEAARQYFGGLRCSDCGAPPVQALQQR